ncbi:glycosyltransferase family 4 protein [Gluconacetobacter entanii]|uniref:Glycosyltransferase family 4 protein n=1 Tax=Gluconacetobacter entanii TaxID=108528 RepID=A0ABT3K5M8_9PROT|nr:glycosyltransferase family 1 protein [Gluconacetobacter entanii]MCW4590377.1 glycosyltransferase family 4 protein [Gluconacetobacter entanii]MCW4594799.1 glycosyltransferase family 4 protein [Gluconacetobacter entanii]NPC89412.1 glycosyltransferase family 4 protein [Gluconacetobacter entanii]
MPETSYLYLDISRLIARAGHVVPTGIDRVEFEYADYLLRHDARRVTFVAISPLGQIVLLPFAEAEQFIRLTEQVWRGQHDLCRDVRRAARLMVGRAMLRRGQTPKVAGTYRQAIYLLLSHHHLNRPGSIVRFLRQHAARFVPMVHDLIPIEFPEYARPREPARHEARMNTVLELARGVIVPSRVVEESLLRYARHKRTNLPIRVVPHGVLDAPPVPAGGVVCSHPYFVCLGTIEPRKNHLLLLNLWRDMVENAGDAPVPHLVLVGRRGWENENIVDMIERCPSLQGIVRECNSQSDPEVTALLRGARGLLFPSFSEGYGLPLSEALKLDVPCVCSDIEVFHEVAGKAATFIDPLDGPGWRNAIEGLMTGSIDAHRPGDRVASAALFPWPQQVRDGLAFLEEK